MKYEEPATRSQQDYALLFAVNDYTNMDKLQNPIANAQAIAQELKQNYGFAVEVVTNPTLDQIDAKLAEYERKFTNGTFDQKGQLFVFFSGHGLYERGNGYFMTKHANPAAPQRTAMEYDYYRGLIDEIPCQHIMVAIDACHSAAFDPSFRTRTDRRFGRPGEREIDRVLANHDNYQSRVFWTSDGVGDQTPDRSQFAYKFLEGLRAARTNTGYITSSVLYSQYLEQAAPKPGGGRFGSDDPSSCFLFFPKARVNIGDTRADGAAYRTAKATGTLAAYRQYLRDYPTGDFKTIVQQEINRLEAEERELLAWERAKQQNTHTAYETFIREHPKSIFVAVAQENLRELSPSQVREGRGGSPDNFIRIPGGTFQMGDQFGDGYDSEQPVHTVQLSTFYLSPTEVIFAEYDAFCTATGRDKPDDSGWGRGQSPAINVSWYDAIEYANWLSQRNNLRPYYRIDKSRKDPNNTGDYDKLKWTVSTNSGANGYRLPTEAEWEYAAREGGRKVRFGNGEDIIRPNEANFYAKEDHKQSYSEAGTYRGKTIAVGSLNHPNSLGLHDMSGNVLEWCWDWYDGSYYNKSSRNDPSGAARGSFRVLRGGSWLNFPQYCRAANRDYRIPTYRRYFIGFRLARSF